MVFRNQSGPAEATQVGFMKSKLNIAVTSFDSVLLAFTQISHGMIRTLPVSELISAAKHIIIAEVYQITKTGYTP
jgi:hypothetical protein